jgi:uncharacterized protein (DUF433 family)
MATVAIDIGTLIGRTPGLHGGVPHIVGKGITVRRIVSWYQRGLMPEEVVHRIGHVTLAEVYAALTYYHANREEIEADLQRETLMAQALERQYAQAGESAL